jgi:hypothetical protein
MTRIVCAPEPSDSHHFLVASITACFWPKRASIGNHAVAGLLVK